MSRQIFSNVIRALHQFVASTSTASAATDSLQNQDKKTSRRHASEASLGEQLSGTAQAALTRASKIISGNHNTRQGSSADSPMSGRGGSKESSSKKGKPTPPSRAEQLAQALWRSAIHCLSWSPVFRSLSLIPPTLRGSPRLDRLHTGKSKGLDLLNEPHPAAYPEFYPAHLSVESMIAIVHALDRLMTASQPPPGSAAHNPMSPPLQGESFLLFAEALCFFFFSGSDFLVGSG